MGKYVYSVLAFVILCLQTLTGQNITVGAGGDFTTLAAAESSIDPGDTVFILNGTYSNGTQFLEDRNGTPTQPIVIMAENEHGAIFQGGSEAIHLVNCSHLEIWGLVITGQSGNGINIDDGGDYSTPTHHITIANCEFRDMNSSGNSDFLKLSGLDSFWIHDCTFTNGGAGGSGIDMVGCHHGTIEDNIIEDAGVTGIQAKGGTQHILIRRNILKDMSQRALNLGGSTGLEFFRPPLSEVQDSFEAADLEVYSNVFIGNHAPIAYVGCVRVKVYNNTLFKPANWAMRILQETTEPGFLTCSDNEFKNNIVYLTRDLTEVNIGPNTAPETFDFSNNLWFNEQSNGSWSPNLQSIPIQNQIIDDPAFQDTSNADFSIPPTSPCVSAGISVVEPMTDFAEIFYHDPPSIGAFEGHEYITSASYHVYDDSITMGPNPSANWLKIDGDFSNATIRILDAGGGLVQDFTSATAPLTISIESLPNGLYFIQIENQENPTLHVTRILKMQ